MIFVTVGTTSFKSLISIIDTKKFINLVNSFGYNKIVVQTGIKIHLKQPSIEYFDLKPSIDDYMNDADLIISHAGTGTIFEALRKNKPLVVVVNDELMNNHQLEIAEELQINNHLVYCKKPNDLFNIFPIPYLEPLPPSDIPILIKEIRKHFGLDIIKLD